MTSLRADAATFVPHTIPQKITTKRQRRRRPPSQQQQQQQQNSNANENNGSGDHRNLARENNSEEGTGTGSDHGGVVVPNDAALGTISTTPKKPRNRGRRKQTTKQQQQQQQQDPKNLSNNIQPRWKSSSQREQQQQQQQQHKRKDGRRAGHARRRRGLPTIGGGLHDNKNTHTHQNQHHQQDESSPNISEFMSMTSFPSLLVVSNYNDTFNKNPNNIDQPPPPPPPPQWTAINHNRGRSTLTTTTATTTTINLVTQLRQQKEQLELEQQQQQKQHQRDTTATTIKLEPLVGKEMVTSKSRKAHQNEDTMLSIVDPACNSTITTTYSGGTPPSSNDGLLDNGHDAEVGTTLGAVGMEHAATATGPTTEPAPRYRRVHNMNRLRNNWWQAWRLRNQRKEVILELELQQQSLHQPSPSPPLSLTEEEKEGKLHHKEDDADNDNDMLNLAALRQDAPSDNFDTANGNRKDTNEINETIVNKNGSKEEDDDDDEEEEEEDESVLWQQAQNPRETSSQRKLALEALVEKWTPLGTSSTMIEHAIGWIIELDHPTLLEPVLRLPSQDTSEGNSRNATRSTKPPPLLLAAQLGRDECLSLLLFRQSQIAPFSSASSRNETKKNKKKQSAHWFLCAQRDECGNNAFHACCEGPLSTESTLQLLLNELLSSSSSTSSSLSSSGGKSKKQQHSLTSKLLLGTNHRGQTPLHVACERGRVDLVETMLQFLGNNDSSSSSLLPKVLVLRDHSHQTPILAAVSAHATNVVLCLLLWRVNDHVQYEKQQLLHLEQHRQQVEQRQQQSYQKSTSSSSPSGATTKRSPTKSRQDQEQRLQNKEDPSWRAPSSARAIAAFSCPLVWAAKDWNLAMLQLLLEFADDHVTPYHHTEALYASLVAPGAPYSSTTTNGTLKDASDSDSDHDGKAKPSLQLECVQLLIQAGANPFQETANALAQSSFSSPMIGRTATAGSGPALDNNTAVLTAVGLASAVVGTGRFREAHSSLLVQRVIQTGRRQLHERQVGRRRDPLLRQQPETFFSAMESKENAEMQNALSQALVQSLVSATAAAVATLPGDGMDGDDMATKQHTSDDSRQRDHLWAAANLYRGGAQIRDVGLERLRWSLANLGITENENRGTIKFSPGAQGGVAAKLATTMPFSSSPLYCQHQQSLEDIKASKYKTELLCRMPWMRRIMEREHSRGLSRDCCCERLTAEWEKQLQSEEETDQGPSTSNDNNAEIVVLVARDGSRFSVHGPIVSQSSQKLDAAVRFATMAMDPAASPLASSTKKHEEPVHPEIQVDMDPRFCQYLLQHIYHGSIMVESSSHDQPKPDRKIRLAATDVDDESEANRTGHDVLELLLIAEEFLCPSLVQECEIRLLSSCPTACFCWSCFNSSRQVSDSLQASGAGSPQGYSYFVNGRGTSRLLTPTTVLDVLAVVQQLESSSIMKMMETSIRPVYLPLTTSSSTSMVVTTATTIAPESTIQFPSGRNASMTESPAKALSALKDAAICVILHEFTSVVQSDAYQEHCSYSDLPSLGSSPKGSAELSEQALLLLQMCLEELTASPFTTNYRRKKDPAFRTAKVSHTTQ